MSGLLASVLIGSGVGVAGTGLGGLAGFLLGSPGKKTLAAVISASGGIMLAMVLLDMMPEAFAGNVWPGTLGIVIGAAFMLLLHRLMDERGGAGRDPKDGLLKMGGMIAIGIAVHNLPEGLAIGSGLSSPGGGGALAVAMMLHDMPEGLAMAVPLRMAGQGFGRVLLLTLLSGLPTGLGALLGYMAGGVSAASLNISLGFAGGAMGAVVFVEMLPGALALHRGAGTLGLIGGGAIGVAILALAGPM